MPKVYIVNTGHNYESAKEFGELVFLTTGRRDVFRANNDFRDMMEQFKGVTAEDYLLVSGLRHSCAIAGWILGNLGLPLNLLIYNNGSYVPRSLAWVMEHGTEKEDDNAPST